MAGRGGNGGGRWGPAEASAVPCHMVLCGVSQRGRGKAEVRKIGVGKQGTHTRESIVHGRHIGKRATDWRPGAPWGCCGCAVPSLLRGPGCHCCWCWARRLSSTYESEVRGGLQGLLELTAAGSPRHTAAAAGRRAAWRQAAGGGRAAAGPAPPTARALAPPEATRLPRGSHSHCRSPAGWLAVHLHARSLACRVPLNVELCHPRLVCQDAAVQPAAGRQQRARVAAARGQR